MKTVFKPGHSIILLLILFQFSYLLGQENCSNDPPANTFAVHLPVKNTGITEVGFPVPPIWNDVTPRDETIYIPNGRPIYALIVSGYASNKYLDEMMLYNFARFLMDKGAYVHYAWWNNLLAPYMERPLHHNDSHPGNLVKDGLKFATLKAAAKKALPGEDYQFLEDAKIFLKEIREHNPNAIIIVAGHSMGGGAVVHLGSETNELIDILAPIDPVGNRNIPFSGESSLGTNPDFNWTRWRVSRDGFRGYRKTQNTGTILRPNCTPAGEWLIRPPVIGSNDPLCALSVYFDWDAPAIRFERNIINLHHRYQQEALFPFDFESSYRFGHSRPTGGISSQEAVVMLDAFTGISRNKDPGGWPIAPSISNTACCPAGEGVGWNFDGHGEIVGYRGPDLTVPLGVRLKTSPECGNGCTGLSWPARTGSILSGWSNGNGTLRKQKLMALESLPVNQVWPDRPYNPDLCKVSQGLISLYEEINKPPTAVAGEDQVVDCTSQDGALVTLDGSQSTDPDGDSLRYAWTGDFGTVYGEETEVLLPFGENCIELTITDLVGHIDRDWVVVEVLDTTGPELLVTLTPDYLWPPNHKMIDISATVEAEDLCGYVESITLYSIVSSDNASEIGSGNTTPDILGAEYGTEDLFFKLRAERSGKNTRRIYTVTYQATDNSGNSTLKSEDVVIEQPSFTNRLNQINREIPDIDLFEDNSQKKPAMIYPNPFSSYTTIDYHLNDRTMIKIAVYDMRGKEIDVLFNGIQKPGPKSITYNGAELPSGIYICRISSNNETVIKRMVLRR